MIDSRARTVLLLLLTATCSFGLSCSTEPPTERIDVRVLVLNFDPLVDGRPLHHAFDWQSPRQLADDYAHDVTQSSGGLVQFAIKEWRDVRAFPRKLDGFIYTVDEYMRNSRTSGGWHQPDGVDYRRIFTEHGVAPSISAGEIDEVWLFGGPYFGYSEAAMAGPRAFDINGEVMEDVPSSRPFAIMGFNYERGVAEMLENLCHRFEATMSRVYGGWRAESLDHDWARFAATMRQSGRAGVGSCHFPPNAEREYDFANTRTVPSNADAWLRYPDVSDRITAVNRDAWGGPDYARNYFRWWFRHLPRGAGTNSNGRLNNWWKYAFQFDQSLAER